jgi:hypothetical protein
MLVHERVRNTYGGMELYLHILLPSTLLKVADQFLLLHNFLYAPNCFYYLSGPNLSLVTRYHSKPELLVLLDAENVFAVLCLTFQATNTQRMKLTNFYG